MLRVLPQDNHARAGVGKFVVRRSPTKAAGFFLKRKHRDPKNAISVSLQSWVPLSKVHGHICMFLRFWTALKGSGGLLTGTKHNTAHDETVILDDT